MDLKHVFLRPVALLLAAAMPFTQFPVSAAAASPAAANPTSALTAATDPNASSESEDAVSLETETSPETYTITGFEKGSSCLSSLTFSSSQKPSLSALSDRLPGTLDVYLDNNDTAVSIPVTWFCVGEDYEQSDGYYFQFSPQWDEDTYTLSDQLDSLTDAPYVAIFLVFADGNDTNDGNTGLSGDGITTAAVTSSSYEEEIFDFLVNEIGFNSAGACGVMANLYHESSFNPHASGDGGTSYGICQWHNERYDSLKSWCKSNDYDYTTLEGQLNYLKFELSQNNSKYLWNGKTIYNNISAVEDQADGSYDSGYYWCVNYEVPANKETVGVTRGNLAKNTYWPEYNTSIASCNAKLSSTVCAYTGKARKPSVTVKDGSTTLEKNTDYTVSYKNNTNVGTASVIIKGTGDYTGQVTLNFTIRLKRPALSKVTNAASGVKVTWSAVTGATGYYIYHKNPGEKWTRIANVESGDTVSYVDTTATAGQTWIYTVKAYDADKNTSKYESGLTIYRLDRPSISSLSNSAANELTVTWKKDSNAKGYQIQYSTESDFSSKTTRTISKNKTVSYTFTEMEKDTTYYVRIRRYQKIDDATYYSAWSKVKDITITQ